jgi:uncharacterized membrane protein
MNKSIPFLAVFGLSIFWTVSIFVAPMTLSPETISGLDGHSNVVDFGELWNSLPPYQRAIYYFGDMNCHQKWYRSFTINGNQMPVDARMTSIFLFVNLGFASMIFAEVDSSLSMTMFNSLPKKLRMFVGKRMKLEVFMSIVTILAILPVAIDGFTQLLTPYESTNLMRVLTGISLGWIGGVLVGAMILSIGALTRSQKVVNKELL